ncbi:hypothetical protein DL762_006201 [Monosporascus cannonballus]|uniref:Uncharacterized protein n=1 Tax=Monosporascus cannonballus TaxID=155416 RepID=A0ABY0H2P8_9PEZI|nr:hypothetical protein DL762_006201 [Monosporascus cannonballus]
MGRVPSIAKASTAAWSSSTGAVTYYTVAPVVREASSRRSKGTVYLNPVHDAFLLMEEFDWSVYRGWRIPSSAANPPPAEKYAMRCTPRRACAQVCKLMETSSYWAEETYEPLEYFDPDPFWGGREQDPLRETMGAMFKGLESCIHLLTDMADDEMPSIYGDLCRIA